MTKLLQNLDIYASAMPVKNGVPNEFSRAMAPHPLIHQELPYKPKYMVYNRRLAANKMENYSADEVYWQVRTNVIMRHTGELPVDIRGKDARKLCDLIFARDIRKHKIGRCSYQFVCDHNGGMITDGVLVQVEEDRFWFAQGDGDVISWIKAHSENLNVEASDTGIWVSQVQGPNAFKVLENAIDRKCLPEKFNYFDMARVSIAGEEVVITRTGFTNELGWEFYLEPHHNSDAIGEKILQAGAPFNLMPTSAEAFRTRRIEAGLLNAGSDFDETTTPFDAGLGHLVDFNKTKFFGKEALSKVAKDSRTVGLKTENGIAELGRSVLINKQTVAKVCSSSYSPYLQCGVAIVRMDNIHFQIGDSVQVQCSNGMLNNGTLCTLPMYDKAGKIVRGKEIDIPKRF